MKTRSVITGLAISLFAMPWGCSSVDHRLGVERDSEPGPFVSAPDSGAPDATELFTNYCPSDRCPPGHTTCPSSMHLCDVDLLTDPNNCGECGNACPDYGHPDFYVCVEGRCKLTCVQNEALNCDGVPDNGCEARMPDNDNCGACGLKCPADKPCIDRNRFDWGCGCRSGELYCPGTHMPVPGLDLLPCVNPDYDDNNCGACRNKCPPTIEGRESPPNTYFGCVERQCGQPKCTSNWGDCDTLPANGCETFLMDDANCGACGNACTGGQTCRLQLYLGVFFPQCMCPEGVAFCKSGELSTPAREEPIEIGYCADLTSAEYDCGGCGVRCGIGEACSYGRCVRTCPSGWGDCNLSPRDGCETNLNADPKNCGACGKVCDGIAGQACVDGRCLVEPCDVLHDGGGPTR